MSLLKTPAAPKRTSTGTPKKKRTSKKKPLSLKEPVSPFDVRQLALQEYAPYFKDLTSPPEQLFAKGPLALSILDNAVAIVGTRRPTEYGLKFAYDCAEFLASKGVTVVSGLALGIDAAAHQGALDVGGHTVGILGTGIDVIYPKENKELFKEMAQRGLILTEFPHGTGGVAKNFPMRNRLVVSVSRAVVVVESDIEGGAMITAELARKMGRRLFALPGRIDQRTSAGPNKLIQGGATLVSSAQELWQFLNNPTLTQLVPAKRKKGQKTQTRAFNLPPELAPLAQGDALTLDELAHKSKVPISQLMMLVLAQELEGAIVKRLDGKYEAV